jgi:HlyD family secretion protein
MSQAVRLKYHVSMRRYLLCGTVVTIALVFGVGGWAATSDISGAVIATGHLVVLSEIKKVQHPTGGVIGQILVKEGQMVHAGEPLLRLDATVTQSNLAMVIKRLDELAARQARLRSERDGLSTIEFPQGLLARAGNAEVQAIIESERRLFDLRRIARDGNVARFKERIDQYEQLIVGLTAQGEAKLKESALIAQELAAARQLWEKKLIQLARLNALEREAVNLEGTRAELVSRIAETKGRIAETELQILQLDRDLNSEVANELREIDARIGEFVERKIAAQDQMQRIELIAPASGAVHQLEVHTVGGVIAPGEVLMLIVPTDDELEVEAKIRPTDVDQLHPHAEAMLRFSAFNQRTTPELKGTLQSVSADVSIEERTGVSYYKARVTIDRKELSHLGTLKLIPGMPAEVFVKTSDRSAMSLLFKPLTDQFYRAFRED